MKYLKYIALIAIIGAIGLITYNHYKPVKSFGATAYTPLKVPGFLGVGSNTNPSYQVHVISPLSANSGTTIGDRQTTSFTPTGAAYTTEAEGAYDYFEVNSGTAVDSAASAVARARYSQAINFSNKAVNSLYGITGECAMGSGATGSVNSCYGTHGDIIQNGGVGSLITNAFAVFGEVRSTGNGSINTGVSFYGDASYQAGTFSHYIGVDIPTHVSVASTSISALFGDSVGIGATSTPGSLLSVQGVANFNTATSTFYSTGGINLTSGCFAVGGTCIGAGSGGGSVSSVSNSDQTLTVTPTTGSVVASLNLGTANSWTTTATTSYAGSVGIGFTPTASRDNILSVKTGRTYTNSGTAQADAGAVNFNGTNNTRETFEVYTTTAVSAPSVVRFENSNTSQTAIMQINKTNATGAAGNLLYDAIGINCPAYESKETSWGTNSYWQWCAHQGQFLLDARNNPDNSHIPVESITSPFASSTLGGQRVTFFPGDYATANGNWTNGTGTFNVFSTSTNSTMMNLTSLRGATEGDLFKVLQNGGVGISSSTPSATATLSIGANPGGVASSTIVMKKLQLQGENSAGVVSCTFMVGTTWQTVNTPCNN